MVIRKLLDRELHTTTEDEAFTIEILFDLIDLNNNYFEDEYDEFGNCKFPIQREVLHDLLLRKLIAFTEKNKKKLTPEQIKEINNYYDEIEKGLETNWQIESSMECLFGDLKSFLGLTTKRSKYESRIINCGFFEKQILAPKRIKL